MTEYRTANCTEELHEKYGGACFWCCDRCNINRHQCGGCGEELRHDGTEYSGATHPKCYE